MNCILWIVPLLATMASSSVRKSAFDRIESVNSRYAVYNDSGKYFQVDMKIPWKIIGKAGRKEDQQAALRRDNNNLWPKGIIPYKLAYSIRKNARTYRILKEAMEEWEKKTCITFVERTNQPDYVEFYYGDGCNSDVGRVGGRQTTSLGRGCAHHGIIVHELGHVIGFWHEQNRPDRDDHVRIVWDNIIPKFQFAFTKYSRRKINSLNIPYDYYSVMHYGSKAFTKNQKPTIQSLKQGITEFGNTHISRLDAKQANLLYKCPDYPKFPEDFFWSSKGRGDHKSLCIKINEPKDPHGWHNNFLCHRSDRKSLDLKWSNKGPLKSMTCTAIKANYPEHFWEDNFLCWPSDSVYKFVWKSGNLSQNELANCLNITEPNDPIWNKNQYYLCAQRDESPVDGQWGDWASWLTCSRQCGGGIRQRKRSCTNPSPSFGGKTCRGNSLEQERCNGHQCVEWPSFPDDFTLGNHLYPPRNKLCIRTYERLDYFKWNNFLLCTPTNKRDVKLYWSDRGRIPEKICTRIYVPKEVKKRKGTWDDNYLCMPKGDAPYRFRFSASGRLDNAECMRWYAKGGKDGWDKTFLCAENILPGWSKWSKWSPCSKTCAGGSQTRNRTCTHSSLIKGRSYCVGPILEERRCNIKSCPVSCGGKLNGEGGQFTSPNFPNSYPDNSDCIWVIQVSSGNIISLQLNYFDIEGPSCKYDFLAIRDGPSKNYPSLGTFCGSKKSSLAHVKSTGNYIWVQFKSDDRINHKGFDISWTSRSDPLATPSGPIPSRCGGMVTKAQGSLTSPLFPTAYPHNIDCTWVIKGVLGKRLHVWFDHFYIDTTNHCQGDYVEVKDGESFKSPTLGRFCGNRTPAPFKSHSNSIRIQLHTDSTRHHRGFRVRWRSVDKTRIRPTTKTALKTCPVGWVQRRFSDKKTYCYLVKRSYLTWAQAWRDCKYNNADLLCLTSKEEENFVINDLNRLFKLGQSVIWLGLNDLANEGVWVWSDNTNKTYKNWAPGDPNNGGDLKNEDCGVLKADGKWNDYPCNASFRYICKSRAPSSLSKKQRRRVL